MTTLTKENDLYFVTVVKLRMFGRVDRRNFKVDFNQRHARLHVDMTRCAKLVTAKDVKSVISHMFSSISYIKGSTLTYTYMWFKVKQKWTIIVKWIAYNLIPAYRISQRTRYKINYTYNREAPVGDPNPRRQDKMYSIKFYIIIVYIIVKRTSISTIYIYTLVILIIIK